MRLAIPFMILLFRYFDKCFYYNNLNYELTFPKGVEAFMFYIKYSYDYRVPDFGCIEYFKQTYMNLVWLQLYSILCVK